MSINCENIGPEVGAPRPICTNYVLCLLTRLGEPPAGAYFWHPKMERGFGVSFCYNEENEPHRSYAAAVLRIAPAVWENGVVL